MEKDIYMIDSREKMTAFVKEASAAYAFEGIQPRKIMNLLNSKEQGEFTIDDLDVFPENFPVELIDGVLYFYNAPTILHQEIQNYLFVQIYMHIKNKNGKCRAYTANTNVLLDRDDKTNIHPDVLVSCNKENRDRMAVNGAPDMVIEILSPSTRRKDLTLKQYKYRNAGVREYWIVDPEKKKLYVYDFAGEKEMQTYELTGSVGVGIFDGELQIDLDELQALITEEENR